MPLLHQAIRALSGEENLATPKARVRFEAVTLMVDARMKWERVVE